MYMFRRPSGVWLPPLAALLVLTLADPVAAHVGGLSGSQNSGSIPTWLTIGTGGVIVGASFLFTSLLTDHEAIRAVNGWRVALSIPDSLQRVARLGGGLFSVGVLALVVGSGLFGPEEPLRNFAILVVWAGWWVGFTMSVYGVGNTWPVFNPWRALAAALPRLSMRTYPARLGAWPGVVGLLGMVWLEVVSPVADDSRLLVLLVLGYTVVTLAGAAVYGVGTWFGTVDPISRVFRCYGRMAPFQRTGDGIELRLPTTALAEHRVSDEPGRAAFVIALLWVTTYDGLVATPVWETAIRPLVEVGIPPLVIYFVAIVAGFALFYSAYDLAARKSRETTGSFVSTDYVMEYFAPSLIPIAAGYHVAHFLAYFLNLAPVLVAVGLDPFSPPTEVLLVVVPDWFGIFRMSFVLLGHLLAIWAAHALAFELFPGVLRPIRSQYPFIVAMVFYTMTSMWVIIQPFTAPPYV